MRKRIVNSVPPDTPRTGADWLELERTTTVEVTSEDAAHPIEAALLAADAASGWRAAQSGAQTIRLIFDQPQKLNRIQLLIIEREVERTQEFVLRWLPAGASAWREIVRQQWHFSPQGSTQELEDYGVDLPEVAQLELSIVPDTSGGDVRASLAQLRLA